MKRLDPNKLFVELRDGVTLTDPQIGRKYTLTHSDLTAELFLNIGLQFAYDKLNTNRDEVLAEWKTDHGLLFLSVYVFVDGQFDREISNVRNMIFRKELPLALEAIRYGDYEFFATHPGLGNAPIWIHFDSTISEYNRLENWGTPNFYY